MLFWDQILPSFAVQFLCLIPFVIFLEGAQKPYMDVYRTQYEMKNRRNSIPILCIVIQKPELDNKTDSSLLWSDIKFVAKWKVASTDKISSLVPVVYPRDGEASEWITPITTSQTSIQVINANANTIMCNIWILYPYTVPVCTDLSRYFVLKDVPSLRPYVHSYAFFWRNHTQNESSSMGRCQTKSGSNTPVSNKRAEVMKESNSITRIIFDLMAPKG